MEEGQASKYVGEESWKILYFTKLSRRLGSEFFTPDTLRLLSLPMEQMQEPCTELVFPARVEWLW